MAENSEDYVVSSTFSIYSTFIWLEEILADCTDEEIALFADVLEAEAEHLDTNEDDG